MPSSLIPVLLGLDLGAYSMAIACYEAFGVRCHAFGRYPCGITEHSRLITTHTHPQMTDPAVGAERLIAFAKEHPRDTLLLIPCADWYMELVDQKREALIPYYRFFLPSRAVYRTVKNKESFYALCDAHGIPYPRTLAFSSVGELARMLGASGISFPAVLKPTDSTEYWRHPFVGMRKVYMPGTRADAMSTASAVFSSGYRGRLLLQERIGQGMARAKTLTVCIDRHGKTTCAALARVVLEERAPTAQGNYSALVTEPLDELCLSLCRMAERIGYTGIANFDILYDESGHPFVLEMNPRQGRSCDYVRASGINLATFLYTQISKGTFPVRMQYPSIFWRCVGDATVRRYAEDDEGLAHAMHLKAMGFAFSPFSYGMDLYHNPVRRLYVGVHRLRRALAFRRAQREVYG